MHSCLYEGRVRHRRTRPVDHAFAYRLYLLYLDLAEVTDLVRAGLLGSSRYSPASFLRQDHLGDPQQPLDEAVRDLVETETGRRPTGPIRLLTQLRHFGYYFSPLNLYYCFDADGNGVETAVAEVSNTPWRELHAYVLGEHNREAAAGLRFRHPKTFHVSPFMDMDLEYAWRLSPPGERLSVDVENRREGERLFDAGMTLARCPLTRPAMRRVLVRFPLMTARIVTAIYYQALRLWMKRCPFYPHPKHHKPLAASRS